MNRAEAAAWIGGRYAQYLTAVTRTAADTAGNLKEAIDDALRALGYAAADIPAAVPTGDDDEDDYKLQLAYRTMAQVSRDLGATSFDVSTGGDSFKLSQLRLAAEKDLKLAMDAVLERFGTLGVVSGDDADIFAVVDTNILVDDWALV